MHLLLPASWDRSQLPRRTLLMNLGALSLAALGSGSAAAENFPNRAIRIIVPTSAGGGNDIIARVISQRLNEVWGRPVVVENRPGADGTIGAAVVAKSPPDGYTLMLCTNAVLSINPPLYPHLAYDPLKDFTPITVASLSPFLLVVHPSLPVTTVAELIAYATAHPTEINYSSSGTGSVTHLAGALFNKMAGIKTVHVPYRGSAPAITDLLSGRIQMRFSAIAPILPLVRAGQLRAIAVTSADRFGLMQDLPTVAATIPGYVATIWYGLVGPAGMASDVAGTIHSEVVRQLTAADVIAKLVADGSEAVGNSPAQFAELMRTESVQWSEIIRESAIQLEK
jgi:tripartite-type tricarboxylate transporter receptor subunit TctC